MEEDPRRWEEPEEEEKNNLVDTWLRPNMFLNGILWTERQVIDGIYTYHGNT